MVLPRALSFARLLRSHRLPNGKPWYAAPAQVGRGHEPSMLSRTASNRFGRSCELARIDSPT
jgi:hypothetical protein